MEFQGARSKKVEPPQQGVHDFFLEKPNCYRNFASITPSKHLSSHLQGKNTHCVHLFIQNKNNKQEHVNSSHSTGRIFFRSLAQRAPRIINKTNTLGAKMTLKSQQRRVCLFKVIQIRKLCSSLQGRQTRQNVLLSCAALEKAL